MAIIAEKTCRWELLQLHDQSIFSTRKIPHTGDKASLDRCGQQHQCHRRVDQEYPKTQFFLKQKKKSPKTQKSEPSRNMTKQRYALRPEVSNPSGSVNSTMFSWTNNTPKPDFFEKRKKSSKTHKLAKISDTLFNQRSLTHWEAWFPPCFVRQNQQKKTIFFCGAILDNFQTKIFKSETTSLHYFSLRIPKI